jgi:hypothetical protein
MELHSVPASQAPDAGYRIGKDQSVGSRTILQPSRRFEISPISGWGVKLGHPIDVRCMTAVPPKADVHPDLAMSRMCQETSRPIISDRLGCLREGCLGLGDELAHNYGHGEDLVDASGCLTCRE